MTHGLANNRPAPVGKWHWRENVSFLRGFLRRFRNRYHLRVPPQPLEVIISARLRGENVDQVIAIIGQNPFSIVEAFYADRVLAPLGQFRTDLFADGLDLLRIRSAADHEKVGERCDLTQIEDSNVDGFLRFGGSNRDEPRRGAKR